MAGTGQLVKLPVLRSSHRSQRHVYVAVLTRSDRETGVDSGCVIVRGIDLTMRAIYY